MVKESILKGDSPRYIKRHAVRKGGMSTLRQSALLKLSRGQTSVDEVLNVSVSDDMGDDDVHVKAVQSGVA